MRTVLCVSWLVAATAAAEAPPDAGTRRVPLQAVVDSLVTETAEGVVDSREPVRSVPR